MIRWQRGQPVTREPASQQFMQFLDQLSNAAEGQTVDLTALEADVADLQTDLTTGLAGKADLAHTHVPADVIGLPEAIDDRVAALLVAGANVTLTYDDTAGTLTIAATGGGPTELRGQAVVTVSAPSLEWSETIAAPGVTAGMGVLLSIAAHSDADENTAEMLDVAAMSGSPGADLIRVEMAFTTTTSGPIRINWSAA